MNVILIMSDTFRYDNLSCYGPTEVKTPNLDRFAQQAHVFANAYHGSFPTIPNRLDIMSGRFSFIDHDWSPLPRDVVTLQQILSASGVTTQLICDNPHMIEMGFNYERGFDGWDWIRGQETDRWRSLPSRVEIPDPEKNRSHYVLQSYLRNTASWQTEADTFVARSVTQACAWLEQAATQTDKFFLHLDLFDPHEPWDAPQKYLDLYQSDHASPQILNPHYEFWREVYSEQDLRTIVARYRAESTLVDHWLGILFDKIEELGLNEDTAVIFTSDHGLLLGEHELVGKSRKPYASGEKSYEAVPMYQLLCRVPLVVRLPRQTTGRRISALVQSPDLMPTILELAGLVSTESVKGEAQTQALQCGVFFTSQWKYDPQLSHGKSLMLLLRGETDTLRDIAVCSNTMIHRTPILAKAAVITEDGWCLHYAGVYEEQDTAGALYTSKLIDPAAARISTEPQLYFLPKDPGEENDEIHANEALARDIHARYVRWLEGIGTPGQYLAGRRKLF